MLLRNSGPEAGKKAPWERENDAAANVMVAFDNNLGKLLAPFERLMGFSLLGAGTATRFSGPVLQGGGNPWNGSR